MAELNPHFLRRDPDGYARLRIRFTPEEAALIEEGAGDTPIPLYVHRVLNERARYHIRKRNEDLARRGLVPPGRSNSGPDTDKRAADGK